VGGGCWVSEQAAPSDLPECHAACGGGRSWLPLRAREACRVARAVLVCVCVCVCVRNRVCGGLWLRLWLCMCVDVGSSGQAPVSSF